MPGGPRAAGVHNGPMTRARRAPALARFRSFVRPVARQLALGLGLELGLGLGGGCTEPAPPPGELVVLPARLDDSGAGLVPLNDGDEVSLVRPIQGGHVLFVGALLRYPADGDGTLNGELRRVDPATGGVGPIVVYDKRTAPHQPLPSGRPAPNGEAGWFQVPPDINNVANIPVCPDFLDYDLVDVELFIRVSFRDSLGREAHADRRVKTRCAQTDPMEQAQCRCECKARYTIDRCLSRPDGGS